jgi:hypothetical protein
MIAFRRALICILLTLFWSGPALAQKRLALVIGNDAYQQVDPLQKAVNDARAMAQSLRKIGFTVSLGENLSRREFVQALARLEAQIRPGDVVVMFYAGHGVEIDGANYLLPVDIPKVTPGQQSILKDEAVSTDGLIQRVKARGARSQILVLDACRENPFRDSAGRSVGGSRGLGATQVSNGVFILYSAGIGEVALDRLSNDDPNPNSVFTRTLVPLIENPELSLVSLAKDVRAQVKDLASSVGHQQSPAYYDEIDGHLFLARLDGKVPSNVQASANPVARIEPAPPSGFIFADSDRRLLTREEILRLPLQDVRLARNEIFARKGRFFKDVALRNHFSRFPWYQPHSWDVTLSPIEQANVNLLQSLER